MSKLFSPLYILSFPDDLRAWIEHQVTEDKLRHKATGSHGKSPNLGNYIVDVMNRHRKEKEE